MRFLVVVLALPLAYGQSSTVPVTIHARLVDADLNVKAVPKHALQIIRTGPNHQVVAEAVTDFDGKAGVSLPAGGYRVQSKSPLEFQKKSYRWDLRLVVGAQPIEVDLSNDNAEVNAVNDASTGRITDNLAAQFKSLQATVFTVWSEFGHGTGS
jgi:hypothetical protein